jgi:predicted nucleotidyltransferase
MRVLQLSGPRDIIDRRRLESDSPRTAQSAMSTVAPILNERLEAIRQICRRRRVARLEAFGSATTDRFDPAQSDVDFLVEFERLSPVERADAYFGLLEDLQDLFQRDVDLIEIQAIDNPYFQQIIDTQRMVLYAA